MLDIIIVQAPELPAGVRLLGTLFVLVIIYGIIKVIVVPKMKALSSNNSNQRTSKDDISSVRGYREMTESMQTNLQKLVASIEEAGDYHRLVQGDMIEFESVQNHTTDAQIEITPERNIKILCKNGQGHLVNPLGDKNIQPTTPTKTTDTVIYEQIPAILSGN